MPSGYFPNCWGYSKIKGCQNWAHGCPGPVWGSLTVVIVVHEFPPSSLPRMIKSPGVPFGIAVEEFGVYQCSHVANNLPFMAPACFNSMIRAYTLASFSTGGFHRYDPVESAKTGEMAVA